MLIGMPAYDAVDMLDVAGPFEMFSWAGLAVELVAEKSGPLNFRDGFSFNVDKTFGEAGAWDVLWVPGGDQAALVKLMSDPRRTYLDFLIRQSEHVKYVASVCDGALLLAAAGLLDGYTVTTHWAFVPCLKGHSKVRVADGYPRYCLDRNRLTGGGISPGLDEALMLVQLLMGTQAAQAVQCNTQYYPCPPVTSEITPATECPLPPTTIAPRKTTTPR
jgi:transcriptional regulator GlxA family with amidase domain